MPIRGEVHANICYRLAVFLFDWKDYVNEDKYTGTEDWIDIEEIETNWYSVKTE